MISIHCSKCGVDLNIDEHKARLNQDKIQNHLPCPSCGELLPVIASIQSSLESRSDVLDMYRFACPVCNKTLKVPEQGIGKKIHCPKCGQRVLIPAPLQSRNKTVLGKLLPSTPRSKSPTPAVTQNAGVGLATTSAASSITADAVSFVGAVVHLSLFAIAFSLIGGAFADFLTPCFPLNEVLCLGTALTSMLLLFVFLCFRGQGVGLACFCLLIVATGFGGWWALAEYKGSHSRGFLAVTLKPIDKLQVTFFPQFISVGDLGLGSSRKTESGIKNSQDSKIASLVKSLASDDATEKIRACNELFSFGPSARGAARALCSVATSNEKPVRLAAIEALEKIRQDIAKAVTTLLVDPNSREAAHDLGLMGESAAPAIPVLLWSLEHSQGSAMVHDIQALAKIGPTDPDAVRGLIARVRWPSTAGGFSGTPLDENLALMQAMGKLTGNQGGLRSEIVACLTKALKEFQSQKRDHIALEAAIESVGGYGVDAERAIPLLKELKLDPRSSIRNAAGIALGKVQQ